MFDHSPCTFHWLPSGNVTNGTAKVHAHLSPFSAPWASHHAPGLAGSVRASEISCAVTFANAARPCEWLVCVSCGSHPASPSRLKKNANCTGTPPQAPELCHAQKFAWPRGMSVYTG